MERGSSASEDNSKKNKQDAASANRDVTHRGGTTESESIPNRNPLNSTERVRPDVWRGGWKKAFPFQENLIGSIAPGTNNQSP